MATPQWKTIVEDLRRKIEIGELVPGARIAGEEDLAREWGVSRQTAHKSVQELQRLGLVVRKRRWGTVVAEPLLKSTGRVALLADRYVPMLNFPQPDLLRGLQDGLGDNFHVVMAESRDDWEFEAKKLKQLQNEVDGIAIYPTSEPRNVPLLQGMFDDGYPMVVLDRFPDGLNVDAVVSDNYEATLRAIRALEARGHRRIGFFSYYKPDFSSVHERYAAYAKALEEVGIEDPTPYTRWLHRDLHAHPSLLVQALYDSLFTLTRLEDPLTAVFCVEDGVASAMLHACERLGISVPDRLDIALFNDWPPMMLRCPWSLHRIVQRPYDIGRTAAGLLLDRMGGSRSEPKLLRVAADFLVADAGLEPALMLHQSG